MADITLDERSSLDFGIYANSVIKARAISRVEDNLKPIHRKVLWTLFEDKVYDKGKTVKCARVVGDAMKYSPHGDSSIYGALVRLAQWWKLKYPLIYIQGNMGNILGDGPAAMRYTECKLSPIGMAMLDGIKNDCVTFKKNYDGTCDEPTLLPSKFPFLLCGNNMGIAVGLSASLVSHNFTEVSNAISYYMEHKDCSIADLMHYIQGPDFPTAGKIINGDELLAAYTTGVGSVKVQAHYDIIKENQRTKLVFTDLPYGIEIENGVKKPLKKLVLDEGNTEFEDIIVEGGDTLDSLKITVVLSKNANVGKCLDTLFQKTGLQSTIKINQTLIVNGQPRTLSLKEMIASWVDYRSSIIKKIKEDEYAKTNHKLTVVIGLQKCMSDIDKLISLIRNAANRTYARDAIMREFELNLEQAEAVLDMKLSKLSRLDLAELNDDEVNLKKTLAAEKAVIEDETKRFEIIKQDLAELKKIIGEDKRQTEILYNRPVEGVTAEDVVSKKEYLIYPNGLRPFVDNNITVDNDLIASVMSYNSADIFTYSSSGEIMPINEAKNAIGAFVKDNKKNKIISVTRNGNIKVSDVAQFKLNKTEKVMKIKDGNELIFVSFCNDNDFIVLFSGITKHVLKLAIKDLPIAGKLTMGVKSGHEQITSAAVVTDNDLLLCIMSNEKGKFVSARDFSVDNRGNKGQSVADDTVSIKLFENGRESIYAIPKSGKVAIVNKNKLSIKSKSATGASITNKIVVKVV